MVGELISIRRGAIRGNPLPVSGPPLDSVISPGCVCSIDKLSRACCTRAGACAFQRGVRAAGARTRPHKANTFLVYFPTISPQSSPCNPRLFSCSVSAEEERQQPRLDVYRRRVEKSAITLSNVAIIWPSSLPRFRLFGYYAWFAFARDCRSPVKPGVEIKGGSLLFFPASCHKLIVVLIRGFILCICYSYFLYKLIIVRIFHNLLMHQLLFQ